MSWLVYIADPVFAARVFSNKWRLWRNRRHANAGRPHVCLFKKADVIAIRENAPCQICGKLLSDSQP